MSDRIDVTVIPYKDIHPQIAETAFVAPGSRIIGDVAISAEASIWYNCVVRGDVNAIRIGARTNIQDGSVIHCDSAYGDHPGYPTIIGEDCLVGHMAVLHGCTLKDRAFVGMGSVVLNGATIESDAMLAAGALLTPGKTIPSGQLWAGRPARYVRDLTPRELEENRTGVQNYVRHGQRHMETIKAA